MKHSRMTPKFFIEFHLLSCLNRLLPKLSHLQRRQFATILGCLMDQVFPYRKKVVMSNLAKAFPEKSSRWRKKISGKAYKYFARIYFDIFAGYRLSNARLDQMIHSENSEIIDRAISENRGVIIVLFHFGNWELIADWLARKGYSIAGVATPQYNSFTDKLVNDTRTRNGLRILPKGKRNTVRIFRYLKQNHLLYMVSDQHAGGQGTWVKFFNQWSSSFQGPIMFALRKKCPVILATCLFNEDGKYDLHFDRFSMKTPENLSDESKIRYLVQSYTNYFEEKIRQHPEQYYWFHRRWKKIPPAVLKELEQT